MAEILESISRAESGPRPEGAEGLASPVALLGYEAAAGSDGLTALRRLAGFVFFVCLAKVAEAVVWPVNLWRLPPFRPTDLASGINWWSWVEPKVELGARVLLCVASGWFVVRRRRRRASWFLGWSAVAVTVVVGANQLVLSAASVARHLGGLEGLSSWSLAPMGVPGLLAGAVGGLFWQCGATGALLGLMYVAGRARPRFSARGLAWVGCATLVPLCLWSFVASIDEPSRVAAAQRFAALAVARASWPTVGLVGDTLDFPVYYWTHLAVAVTAGVALATNLRRRRPLGVVLVSVLAVAAAYGALLSIVVVAEYLGWSPARFGCRGDLSHAVQWVSAFARRTLESPAYLVACLILVSGKSVAGGGGPRTPSD